MGEMDQYDEWDLTPLPVPPRSTLYALQPIGMGTPLVESLSSYITRLAEAHSVFSGLLLYRLIVPLVPDYSPAEKQHGLFRESGQRSTLLNGTGLPAKYAVQALETLTLRTDLHLLTLLPLAAIFPPTSRGLLRLTKAWCPLCYEDQRKAAQPIYDPLLWFFQDVVLCPHHHSLLSTICPYQDCAKPLPAVSWRSRAGYCSYCQRWLGRSQEQVSVGLSVEDKEWRWRQWVALTVEEMLAQVPSSSPPERQRVRQVARLAVQQLAGDNVSAFAQTLGIFRNTVDWWHQGERVPELARLLWLCQRTGLSLREFLFGEITTLSFHFQEALLPGSIPSLPRTSVHTEQIYQALEQILADNEQPPPALKTVAQRLKLKYFLLYKAHPAACYEIAARYKAYVQQRKESRLQSLQEEVKQVVLQLCAEGIAPTQKRIAPHLSQPGILRNPNVRAFLNTICSETEERS
jgi:transcriptional regulator with XRE-family HTH domain